MVPGKYIEVSKKLNELLAGPYINRRFSLYRKSPPPLAIHDKTISLIIKEQITISLINYTKIT